MFNHNSKTKAPEKSEAIPASSDAVSPRAKFEEERLSRRQALKKLGISAGIMLVAMPSIDELARLASKQLAANAGDSDLAKSLRNAGVAMADPNNEISQYGPFQLADCEERCKLKAAQYVMIDGVNVTGTLTNATANSLVDYCRSHHPNVAGGNWGPYLDCLVDGLNRATSGKYQSGTDRYILCCEQNCMDSIDYPNGGTCTRYLVYNPSGIYHPGR